MTAALPGQAFDELFERLKADVDLHDLAERLGLQRKGAKGNYRSPTHPDENPSLSITPNARGWKDWSTGAGGSCIDLVMLCRPDLSSPAEAARELARMYGVPWPSGRVAKAPAAKLTTAQFIAKESLKAPDPAIEYLAGRGVDEAVSRHAIEKGALGWNTWTNAKVPAGETGHGGPAAVFIVRSLDTRSIEAVDLRYADATLNGGQKTTCQGAKEGHLWTSDLATLKRAHTVYVVESPINALSVECCPLPSGTAVVALRGTGNAEKLDLAFLKGRLVLIALDHADPINERTGQRPGLAAAWRLSDRLVAADIRARLIDMQEWDEGQDINDVLQAEGAEGLWSRLKRIDSWLIPGMPGGGERLAGTSRVWLPPHDFKVYWRYRVIDEFTQYVEEFKDDDDGKRQETLTDLCGFRLAGLSSLRIQGHMATINGTTDTQPENVYGISAQVARHTDGLLREVVDSSKLYNLAWWVSKFGPIYKPNQFQRMVNILERTAGLGSRDVVNFIGVAWRDGQLSALEGSDCYFIEPQKQCVYHNMKFPRGAATIAREVVDAYQATFASNAAAIPLVWALGAHLKAVLGFYPHFQMQAEKGAGKSKLLESLQATLAFQVLSGQMLKTDHRRRASASYTSHPVGWDEFSKLPKQVLSDIDGLLQSTYRFEFTRVGASLTPYLMCAPVLLAGEEVDVVSLQSKICRSQLTTSKQGAVVPRDLSPFPVWAWLQFIAATGPQAIRDLQQKREEFCRQNARSSDQDATARRMMENYAAVLTAWDLLCQFGAFESARGGFVQDLIREMNEHIADTDGTRLPWVWIVEILLSEIDARRFEHPFIFDRVKPDDGPEEDCLLLRTEHVMEHIATAPHLRGKFDALPIKTGTIFRKQLMASGVIVAEKMERTIHNNRVRYLVAISLNRLDRLGLSVSRPI